MSNLNKEGFGPRLDVTIPLIAGGQGAITGFHVKIFKTFKYKGKKRSYVSATCLSKKLKIAREIHLQGRRIADPVGDAEVHAEAGKEEIGASIRR